METETQEIDVTNIYDINHLKSIIASLKSGLAVARADLVVAKSSAETYEVRSNKSRQSHEQDIDRIGTALLKEAEDRDWCSAYDDFVEELNRSLNVELKTREHEYEVEIEVTQKRTQRVTVTINARTESHARELIEDDPSNYYEEKICDYDWEVEDEDSDIIDITEQQEKLINITEEQWFTNPFEWYEETEDKYVVSLQLTENKALDVLAGLYDVYKNFKRNDRMSALEDLNALAILLIAHAMGYSEQAIEELLVLQAQENMDTILEEILEEDNK